MKLINIPGLCAIPRIFDAAKDLMTAEDEKPTLPSQQTFTADEFNAALAGRTHALREIIDAQEQELAIATEMHTLEIDLPADLVDQMARKAAQEVSQEEAEHTERNAELHGNFKTGITSEYITTDWARPSQGPTTVGEGDLDERLSNDLNRKLENTPGTVVTEPVTKKRASTTHRKHDMRPLTKAEYDLLRYLEQQRINWNAMHPGETNRSKVDMYKTFRTITGFSKSNTALWEILKKGSPGRDEYPDAPVGVSYDTSTTILTNTKDIKKLYEE